MTCIPRPFAALTLAEEAGDQGAAALALSALSKAAFWDGHRDDAAVLAMRGYELAGGGGSLRGGSQRLTPQ
jgi:hypothetical protein